MGFTANLVPQSQNKDDVAGGTKPIELTDESFKDQTGSGIVFVDFWAEWCTPCKIVAPTIDKLAVKWQGKIKFAKLDTETYPVTPGILNIMSLPTFLVFVNGEKKAELIGAAPENVFNNFLDDIFSKYGAKA